MSKINWTALGKLIEFSPRIGYSYLAEAYHLSFLICLLGWQLALSFTPSPKERRNRGIRG